MTPIAVVRRALGLPVVVGLALITVSALLVAGALALTGWDLQTLVIVALVPCVSLVFLLMAAQDIGAIAIETIRRRRSRTR